MVSLKAMRKAIKVVAQTAKKLSPIGVFITTLIASTVVNAEYRLNFQDPVTEVARDIYGLHMLIFWICVAIFVGVFGVMFYSIFKHRKSKNYQASQFSHSTKVEIIWTIIPFLILVVMAIPATTVLIKMEDTTKSDLTIKITGYQWKWGYEYIGTDVSFYSTLSTPREQIDQFGATENIELGENYLLETDNHLIVPSGRKIRALITANDVIHAWWIPAFGTKKDAIPGYINELWFNVDEGKEGIYRGQCAELCGKDHAYMPIVVEVVTGEEFDQWLAAANGGDESGDSQIEEQAQAEEAAANEGEVAENDSSAEDAQNGAQSSEENSEENSEGSESEAEAEQVSAKTWTQEQLMTKGQEVSSVCVACHGAEGKGVAGVFPAIAASPIATGPIDDHINIVMFGKAGTAMAAFASQLNDEELASVITYQRNAFGNDTGDVVLPSDIKARRK
jgi:cytochrome c oxidase subunit 2